MNLKEKLNKSSLFAIMCIMAVLALSIFIGFSTGKEKETKEQAGNVQVTNTPTSPPTPTQNLSKFEPINISNFYDKSISEIESKFSTQFKPTGEQINTRISDEKYEIYMESTDKRNISFVTIAFKSQGKCNADKSILEKVDSLISSIGMDPSKKGSNLRPEASINKGDLLYQDIIPNTYTSVTCSRLDEIYKVSVYRK